MSRGAVLVTGGAGYVGSAVARRFAREGLNPVVLDDLSRGHAEALPPGIPLFRGDFADAAALDAVLRAHPVEGLVHCAALSLVEESVREPARYRKANLDDASDLVRRLADRGVSRVLLSSTAAIYGEPREVPIRESHPVAPTSPYGASKAALEAFLDGAAREGRIQRVSLRYFNAAGADPSGEHGEDHRPETHGIPRLLSALRDGGGFSIFGSDYPTEDGTPLRDYVHIEDLADAHVLAWKRLEKGQGGIYNIGTGTGRTVRQVVEIAQNVSGRKARLTVAPRRAGDPARLVADGALAGSELGWKARRSLEEIVESAWRWHTERPRGYGEGR